MSESDLSSESSSEEDLSDFIHPPVIKSIIPGRSGKKGSQTLRFEWLQGDKFSAGKVFKT